ncbi:MAG TPA: protein kinase [Polyangiaceae bacterium]|jgi:serine/threonine-protein kinase|nr:protein kinase [Polyangiaceae bacterium]
MATCPQCRRRYSDADEYCDVDGSSLVPDATFASVDRDLAAGEMVGEYRIDRIIGKGSFGVVYKAVHPVIGKAAAVKILKREFSSNPQMVSRFIAEARAVNQIRHRNIVDIFSFGVFRDGRQYYVMELLEGAPLDQFLTQRGPIPVEEALPILDRIARALDAAHGAGIVHRDLKPANVFLAEDEGHRFPKLLDFGVAKLMREEPHADFRTTTGAMLGTPHYMSPEQCRGDAIDYRTDVYSFGVMIHQILTGRLPFDAESILKVMNMHNSFPPPSMTRHNPALPDALNVPVLHMLEKDPARRPESCVEACREIAEAARVAGLALPSLPASSNRTVVGSEPPRAAYDSGRPSAARTGGTLSAQTFSNHPPRKLVFLTTAVSAGAAVVLATLLAVTRMHGPTPAASASSDPSGEPTSTARASASAPGPAPSPAGDVHLSVQSTPPAAEAFLDGRSLGTAPGPLALPRSDKALTLQFRAAGFHPKNVDVTPSADGVVSVTLTPLGAPAPHAHGKRPVDDLEF